MPVLDVLIIGGGIVGLATAYNLSQAYHDLGSVLLETPAISEETGDD